MLITVIITCYNLETYIAKAIDSVINQDFDPLLYEIVVVDDCSTDRSPVIINSYRNVRYLRTDENLGVLGATVIGLENTDGELVCFLDGDDIWEPSKLSTVVELFNNDRFLAFVTHDLSFIDSEGQLLARRSRSENVMATVSNTRLSHTIRDGILLHSDYVWLGSAYTVHRKLGNLTDFCSFAKKLPDSLNTYQDWPLAFWVACQQKVTFGYVDRKLFHYRLHGLNHSGDASSASKALRNYRRTHNTMQAIKQIAVRFDVADKVQVVTDRKLAFSVYLVFLYSGQRWCATRGLFLALPHLLSGSVSFWKELIRFFGVQILGVDFFVRLAAARN